MRFTKTHEWIKVDGTVGVTEYAQKELGDVVFISTAKVGDKINAGDTLAVLESTKAAVDIFSPVSGEIIEVNQALQDKPELINESPEENGWVCKIKTADDLSKLWTITEYKNSLISL